MVSTVRQFVMVQRYLQMQRLVRRQAHWLTQLLGTTRNEKRQPWKVDFHRLLSRGNILDEDVARRRCALGSAEAHSFWKHIQDRGHCDQSSAMLMKETTAGCLG